MSSDLPTLANDNPDHGTTNEPETIPQKVRITFIADCETEVLADLCTLFGRPEMAEPFLCEEFLAIVEAFFRGTVTVVASTVTAAADLQPTYKAA